MLNSITKLLALILQREMLQFLLLPVVLLTHKTGKKPTSWTDWAEINARAEQKQHQCSLVANFGYAKAAESALKIQNIGGVKLAYSRMGQLLEHLECKKRSDDPITLARKLLAIVKDWSDLQ